MKYLNNLFNQLKEKGIQLKPCTGEEIEKIKGIQFKKLPDSYIEYLSLTGGGCGSNFLKGHSCFVSEIPYLKKWANELLDENRFLTKLGESDFVFWMSQGYQFAFFNLDEGDDPPIYYYREGSGQSKFEKISSSFSEFLLAMLNKDTNIFNLRKAGH
jgi:hypothetical protein